MIHTGDCVEVMRTMPADSVDAVVTDPPYGLEFMGRDWDKLGATTEVAREGADRSHPFRDGTRRIRYGESARTMQAWHEQWAIEAFRVLKPGGYLLAFGGTRTVHRLASAIEDAGFEIRDELVWIYASGFPKSLNLGNGWGTALKPAHEPIVMARKPLIGTVAANVSRFGTGALNIDGSRIGYASEADKPTQEEWNRAGSSGQPGANGFAGQLSKGMKDAYAEGKIPVPSGRWPSNLLLSDSELFDQPNPYVVGSGATSDNTTPHNLRRGQTNGHGIGLGSTAEGGEADVGYGDSGGYARFFIVPKADRADREPTLRGQLDTDGELAFDDFNRNVGNTVGKRRENQHPTVKPTDLMRHLVRLVTPPGGTVLDCFLGSGSTAIACELEGFPWVGIEREPEYVAIAEARLNGVQRGLGLDVPAPTKAPPKTHPDLSKHQPKRRAPAENWSGGWIGSSTEAGVSQDVEQGDSLQLHRHLFPVDTGICECGMTSAEFYDGSAA